MKKNKFSKIMKNLSAKNNEGKNDFSASLRPFGTHNSRYLQGLRHILLRYRYGESQISANVVQHILLSLLKIDNFFASPRQWREVFPSFIQQNKFLSYK
jgi:hypothetical protein